MTGKMIYLFFALTLLPLQGQTKEIILGSFFVPTFVESPTSGGFHKIVQAVNEKYKTRFRVELYPPKRTVEYFDDNMLVGFFPAVDLMNTSPVYKSSSFISKRDYLFYLQNKRPTNLVGKKICLTRGYPYAPSLVQRQDIEFFFAASDKACMKMLQLGRVDAVVVEMNTGIATVKFLGQEKNIIFDRDRPLSEQEVFFAFKRDKEGLAYSKLFSNIIDGLKKQGKLNELLGVLE